MERVRRYAPRPSLGFAIHRVAQGGEFSDGVLGCGGVADQYHSDGQQCRQAQDGYDKNQAKVDLGIPRHSGIFYGGGGWCQARQ